ncbi:MAG: hypothetical protein JKX76_02415 [Colwellia sp.]|nr:hypothetical protein [Colwellia sp.]
MGDPSLDIQEYYHKIIGNPVYMNGGSSDSIKVLINEYKNTATIFERVDKQKFVNTINNVYHPCESETSRIKDSILTHHETRYESCLHKSSNKEVYSCDNYDQFGIKNPGNLVQFISIPSIHISQNTWNNYQESEKMNRFLKKRYERVQFTEIPFSNGKTIIANITTKFRTSRYPNKTMFQTLQKDSEKFLAQQKIKNKTRNKIKYLKILENTLISVVQYSNSLRQYLSSSRTKIDNIEIHLPDSRDPEINFLISNLAKYYEIHIYVYKTVSIIVQNQEKVSTPSSLMLCGRILDKKSPQPLNVIRKIRSPRSPKSCGTSHIGTKFVRSSQVLPQIKLCTVRSVINKNPFNVY